MEAIEQEIIDGRTDFFLRGFHQSEAQIGGRISNAVKVARKPPVGRGDHNAASMHKLMRRLVPAVSETYSRSEARYRILSACQEVPSGIEGCAGKLFRVARFRLRGHARRLRRIKADDDHVVFAPGVEG